MSEKKWGVYVYERSIHVVPEWEKPKHDKSIDCSCVPHMELEGRMLLVRHNAFDGTHLVEDAEDLIKEQSDEPGSHPR